LEREGRVKAVVTQNIDGLHQEAGSKTVYELHGSAQRNICTECKKPHSLAEIMPPSGTDGYIPRCECGAVIKPDVVLYGEPLDEETVQAAINVIKQADMLIVGGTSLSVYPAASLVQYFKGHPLALINRDATSYDSKADIIIRDAIGTVLNGCIGTE
jgi:NAD-dependent deacetylase